MKEIIYTNETISNASNFDACEIDKEVIEKKFPHLKGRINAKVIKVSFPVGVVSTDKGRKRILGKEAMQDRLVQLRDMPVHYADDAAGLPDKHHNGDDDNRPEIGHILTAELNGENVETYVLTHPRTQKKATDLIKANKGLLGCSWELFPKKGILNDEENTETITDFDYVGLAILDKNAAAYSESKIMVASKDKEEKEMSEEKVVERIVEKNVIDAKLVKEVEELRAAETARAKEKETAEVQKKIDAAKSEMEKIKAESDAKIKVAEDALAAMKKAAEDKAKLEVDAKAKADDDSRKANGKKRAEELKDYLALITEDKKKTAVLSYLEKITDEEYDIFKEGKTKIVAKEKDLLIGTADIQGFVSKEQKDVTDAELQSVYGSRYLPVKK